MRVRHMNIPSEAEEQKTLFQWVEIARKRHPELGLLYHIPNGGSRNRIEARNLKLQGVKAGVPDICLPVARGGYSALYIEMKNCKGGRLSNYQREWLTALANAGNLAVVCNGWEQAKETILRYLEEATK